MKNGKIKGKNYLRKKAKYITHFTMSYRYDILRKLLFALCSIQYKLSRPGISGPGQITVVVLKDIEIVYVITGFVGVFLSSTSKKRIKKFINPSFI